MSIPLARSHPLAGLSGLWLMSEDRAKRTIAHVADVFKRISKPEEPKADDGEESPVGIVPNYVLADGVATIPVVGTLTKYPLPEPWMDEWCGFCPALRVKASLDEVVSLGVTQIVLAIDSPGGMVAGTSELVDTIARYRATRPDITFTAAVSDMAASGGYYIASQCNRITCNAMGEVGCIGVYAVLVDDSKFWSDIGITMTVVSSGGVKGLGADGKVTEELIADQQRGVDAMHEKFIADVASGRRLTPEQARRVGNGQTWLAAEAKSLGLIDEIANVDNVLATIVAGTSTEQTKAAKSGSGTPAPKVGTTKAVTDGRSNHMADSAPTGDGQTTQDSTLNDADVKFLNDMIPHHQKAIDMANGVKADGSNPDVLAIADKIITTQTAEIEQMQKLLGDKASSAKPSTTGDGMSQPNTGVIIATLTEPIATAPTLVDLIAACEGDKSIAADCSLAGMTVDQAKVAYGIAKRDREVLAAKDQQIARLQFEATGQRPLGTLNANGTTNSSDPEATAKAEWAKMDAKAKSAFLDEKTYVAIRKRELAA